ncbi:DUF4232 domain-containing protein [Streptomyces purpureus]|uniref:DUF4232 domain-containing protein n=1 Tax=Streptomyces purpureus TaxID=1951 RepID=A0A918GYA1_9ACTN|nr:DUF4232 domain-containing protein [Streptomyces purpureus]GGT18120.1 hypothetical protein GCM10014713_08680 [Streptomyces purpureus]
MRTFSIRRTAVAAAVLAAALSATACGADDVTKDPSPAAKGVTAGPSASALPPTGGTDTAGKDTSGEDTSGKETAGQGSSGKGGATGHQPTGGAKEQGGQAKAVTCTGYNTKVVADRPARPINHLLLTATNKGSVPCDLYGAPFLRFGQDQAATAIDEATRPQSVIRLAPGQSAYAAVVLAGERTGSEAGGRDVTQLAVLFAAGDGSGSTGRSVSLKLQAGTYKTDDAKVTYWQNSLDDALGY